MAVGNPLVESSYSYLAGLIHDSCSQAEDSESRVAVMTPSSQRSPTPRISTPTGASLGSPAHQASQSAAGSPVPCPASVSPSLSSVSPPRKQHPQDQVITPETPGLGDHIPGTQPRPHSRSSPLPPSPLSPSQFLSPMPRRDQTPNSVGAPPLPPPTPKPWHFGKNA